MRQLRGKGSAEGHQPDALRSSTRQRRRMGRVRGKRIAPSGVGGNRKMKKTAEPRRGVTRRSPRCRHTSTIRSAGDKDAGKIGLSQADHQRPTDAALHSAWTEEAMPDRRYDLNWRRSTSRSSNRGGTSASTSSVLSTNGDVPRRRGRPAPDRELRHRIQKEAGVDLKNDVLRCSV